MRYDYYRRARIVYLSEQLKHLLAGRAVQSSGRFVSKYNRRFRNCCARYCNTLLLSAGKFVRKVIHPVLQSHFFKRVHRHIFAQMLIDSLIPKRHHRVFKHRH